MTRLKALRNSINKNCSKRFSLLLLKKQLISKVEVNTPSERDAAYQKLLNWNGHNPEFFKDLKLRKIPYSGYFKGLWSPVDYTS